MLNAVMLEVIVLASLILGLAVGVFYKSGGKGDKLSPFECGFEPIRGARVGFSLRFFLLAVLFLIFDVEVALLVPLPLVWGVAESLAKSWALALFLIMLMAGLLYEWAKGALDWAG